MTVSLIILIICTNRPFNRLFEYFLIVFLSLIVNSFSTVSYLFLSHILFILFAVAYLKINW